MKIKSIFTLCVITFFGFSQENCSFEYFFPLKFGVTKFNAITLLASKSYFKEDENANKYSSSFWYKPDYLKGDSVYKSF